MQGNISLVGNALDNLTFLETVDLSYNNLTGSIPDSGGFCSMVGRSLKLLNMEFNNIQGQIPECLLGVGTSHFFAWAVPHTGQHLLGFSLLRELALAPLICA